MKAKLLRKVRKRYSIVSYPNGIKHTDLFTNMESNSHILVLFSNRTIISHCRITENLPSIEQSHKEREYRLMGLISYQTELEGYRFLHMRMLREVLGVYEKYGVRRNAKRNVSKKLYLKNEGKAIKRS